LKVNAEFKLLKIWFIIET